MPERDRLASSLFLVAPIRSDEGRSVLRDMIALCQQDAEVPFRPGLEPEKCTCLMADHKLESNRFVKFPPPNLSLIKKATNEDPSPQETGGREMEAHLRMLQKETSDHLWLRRALLRVQ